jgi:hypothetical protein
MEQRRIRLGDVIDDYCPRCRLVMNHGVVGMIGSEVKKVRCNTCLCEHQFRHGRLPARRRGERGRLFEEVLKGMPRGAAVPPPPAARGEDAAQERAPAPEEGQGPDGARAPDAGPAEAPPGPPTDRPHAHRRLYTIRRSMAAKVRGRDPKKS